MTTTTETAPAGEANGVRPGQIVLPSMLDWDAIRARLAAAMKDKGLSQRGLAEAAHIGSHATLSKFLGARNDELELETLAALAMALETPLEDLAGLERGEAGEGEGTLRLIPHDRIAVSLFNPRQTFDSASIDGMADSIAADGLLQPLVVRPVGGGDYLLVAGERRWRAIRKLIAAQTWPAGKPVACVVRPDLDNETHLALALAENVQREDLSPLEEAAAFKKLTVEFDWNTERIAAHFGKTQRWVQMRLGLLELTATAREALAQGILPAAAARHLPRLTDHEQNKVVEDILSGALLPHEARVLTRIRSDETRRAAPAGEGDEDDGQMDIEDITGAGATTERDGEAPGWIPRHCYGMPGKPDNWIGARETPAGRWEGHYGCAAFHRETPMDWPTRDAALGGAASLFACDMRETSLDKATTPATRSTARDIMDWANDRGLEFGAARIDMPGDFTPPPPEGRLRKHAELPHAERPHAGVVPLAEQPAILGGDAMTWELSTCASPVGPSGWPASVVVRDKRNNATATYRLERVQN